MNQVKKSACISMSLALIASACAGLDESSIDSSIEPLDEPAPGEDGPSAVPDDSFVPFAAGDPCFDWPLGGSQGGSIVPGWGTYVMQNYANRGGSGWYNNRAHAGVDLALDSGATAGAAVYAAADGVVRCVVNANYPGWVTVIEHTLGNGTKKYTQYGHTNQPFVSVNTTVTKGQQIATVLNQSTNSHLHFEVRNWLYYNGNTANCYGPGYAEGTNHPDVQGWANPVDWHFGHRAAFPGQGVTDIAQTVRNAPNSATGSGIATLAAGTRYSVSQVSPDTSGSKWWWYQLQYATNAWGWAAGYTNSGWGGQIYVVEPVRSCGAPTGGMNGNTPSGQNLALSAACSSDSVYGAGWDCTRARDGVMADYSKWTSTGTSATHWLTYDLGSYRTVNGFIVRHAGAAGEPAYFNTQQFRIQSASSWSGPWTDETVVDNNAQEPVTTRSYYTPKSLRYIRLYITDPGIDNWARIPELEVRGP